LCIPHAVVKDNKLYYHIIICGSLCEQCLCQHWHIKRHAQICSPTCTTPSSWDGLWYIR